jgi:ATP-dependent exoDNAse (exonuclease V) alpha subunit
MKQSTALKIMREGRNTFLTGSAGTGKTYALNEYISWAKSVDKKIAITASTGIAATHLDGQTIHSFSGIGIYSALPPDFYDAYGFKRFKQPNIRRIETLIIDEISMLNCLQFELVDEVFRHVRKNNAPFGGVQVIVCGDFFQLPPVSREGAGKGMFATESKAWESADFAICYLTEQFRQREGQYANLLENIRSNSFDEECKKTLDSRVMELKNDLETTHLYTRNINVDKYNLQQLGKLEGDTHIYEMTGTGSDMAVQTLKRGCLAPENLHLKEGALVMSLKNDVEGKYMNGSRGFVKGFEKQGGSETVWPIVKFDNGNTVTMTPGTWQSGDGVSVIAEITQVPLRLAWGITVHKSQGMTLDAANIDLTNAFEKGMGYVALSRLKSIEGLTLLGYNQIAVQVSDTAIKLDEYFRERSALLEQLYSGEAV